MIATTHPQSNAPLIGLGTASMLANLIALPRLWWKRHQAREALITMDDRMLADIGLTHGNAVLEWQKAFWEA